MIASPLAQRVAETVADMAPTHPAGALPGDLAAMCDDAATRVVAATGLLPASPLPPPEAVGRPAWIAANLTGLEAMLGPLTDRVGEGLGPLAGPARAAGEALVAAEAGALVGFLGQRVLGQYELVLLDSDAPARLLFVAPNLLEAARRLGAEPAQLLRWVAFHEVTHAVQFAGVPWLRPHLAGLLGELLESLDVRVSLRALRLPGGDDLRALVERVREGGLVTAFAGPERQALLDRLQVTMAVVEGHAEHVMDLVGGDVLEDVAGLRAALDRRRRERPPALRLLERLLGLDLKLRQYEEGRAFCDAVAAARGEDGLRAVWSSPEALPTPAELADPAAWLRRHPGRRLRAAL